MFVALTLFASTVLGAVTADEQELKVALVYKLSKFVDWPVAAIAASDVSFDICSLGDDDFGHFLEVLVGRKVAGQPIAVQQFSQSDAVSVDCDILYISASKRAFLGSILEKLSGQPILTVGDIEGFAAKGGMIQITVDLEKVGFTINLENARSSRLVIAAPLLQLATIAQSTAEGHR